MSDLPLPIRDDLNRAYWDGAQEGKLVIQRCPACQTYIHPPREMCTVCWHEPLEPTEVSGKGSIYSWSVMHSRGNPGFEDRLPYAVLIVELAEQQNVRIVGNLVGSRPDELAIGTPMQVVFEKVNDEITLPQWRIAGADGESK